MTFSSAFHGTTNSISSRKTSRRVFFLLPAYSASAKLIWPIASTPLPDSTSHGVIGGLVQTFLREARLIVACPEQVMAELEIYDDELKDRWYDCDENLENSLLGRNDPLIDLGLARYAREPSVVASLYQKSRARPSDRLNERYLAGLGVACLSNEVEPRGFSHFPENIIGEEETARLIAESGGPELAALLSNRNFASKIETLYRA